MPNISKNKKRLPWEWKPTKNTWSHNEDKRYNSPQWRATSKQVIFEEPFCKICEKKGIVSVSTCTDHILAVRLGGSFWDRSNLQGACKPCNNAKKV